MYMYISEHVRWMLKVSAQCPKSETFISVICLKGHLYNITLMAWLICISRDWNFLLFVNKALILKLEQRGKWKPFNAFCRLFCFRLKICHFYRDSEEYDQIYFHINVTVSIILNWVLMSARTTIASKGYIRKSKHIFLHNFITCFCQRKQRTTNVMICVVQEISVRR